MDFYGNTMMLEIEARRRVLELSQHITGQPRKQDSDVEHCGWQHNATAWLSRQRLPLHGLRSSQPQS